MNLRSLLGLFVALIVLDDGTRRTLDDLLRFALVGQHLPGTPLALEWPDIGIFAALAGLAAKDEAKELESRNKLVRARDRATRKAEKEAEVRQRREDRAARAAAKKAEDALQKALKTTTKGGQGGPEAARNRVYVVKQ